MLELGADVATPDVVEAEGEEVGSLAGKLVVVVVTARPPPGRTVTSTQFWNSSPHLQRLQPPPGQFEPKMFSPQSEAVYPAAVSEEA